MALQNSGAISLDDIHVEVGGTSGTQCSINASDIRELADKSDGATSSFNEFYGLSSVTYMQASGGQESTSGNFKFHKYNSSSNFVVNQVASGTGAPANVDYIIIAGGGGGGNLGGQDGPGGGGAGGYRTGQQPVTSTGTISVRLSSPYWSLISIISFLMISILWLLLSNIPLRWAMCFISSLYSSTTLSTSSFIFYSF